MPGSSVAFSPIGSLSQGQTDFIGRRLGSRGRLQKVVSRLGLGPRALALQYL